MREKARMTERPLNPTKAKGGGIWWSGLQWTGKLLQMSIFLPAQCQAGTAQQGKKEQQQQEGYYDLV